ncbi:MAG: hypothetical protein HY046_03630 [Acidobacteria bacterium]|nr:hypothetical protein [Acidobacteriota bacterium]
MKKRVVGILAFTLISSNVSAQSCSPPDTSAAKKSAKEQKLDSSHDHMSFDVAAMYKHHYTRVNADFATAGQPTIADVERAKSDGFKSIINLQEPSEFKAIPEEATAKKLGLRFYNIPVVYMNPRPEQVDEFLRIADDPANRPMLLHCTMAIRAGAFWMIRRVLREGWDVNTAEAEAEKLGLGAAHLKKFARDYIASHPAKFASAPQEKPAMLVSAAWVAEKLEKKAPVVLLQVDMIHSNEKPPYQTEHIPGAQLVTLTDVTYNPPGGPVFELRPIEELTTLLRRLGITENSEIVLYFEKGMASAMTRVYFTLDYLGLAGRTHILDGGLSAWKADGRAVTAQVPTTPASNISLKPNPALVVDAAWVNSNLKNPAIRIVDSRDASFYTGENNANGRIPRPGHIPGAVSIPFSSLLEESGKFKTPSDLQKIFTAAGIQTGTRVITYCHIGQQATVDYFVARMLGYNASLYDGSFTEWGGKPELPVDGPAPKETPKEKP